MDHSEINIPGRALLYTNPQPEVYLGSITPDVTVDMDGVPVYIEIAVTHAIEITKQNHYRSLEMKCIEIDLTKISYDFSRTEIEELVLSKTFNKKIIFWERKISPERKNKDDTSWLLLVIGIFSAIYFLPELLSRFRKWLRF